MHKYTEQEPFMYKNEEILSISVRSFREKQAFLQPESAWIKQEILDLPHKSLIDMKKCGSQNLFCGLKIFFSALHLSKCKAENLFCKSHFYFLRGNKGFTALPPFILSINSLFSYYFCHVEYRHFSSTHLYTSL